MISEYTKSLKIYAYIILGVHVLILTYFFPLIVLRIICVPAMFMLFYKWVELVYEVEQANRDNLIMLIKASENENTKKLLLKELWLADLHSLGGEPLDGCRI
tara:strand:+ start:4898 stop:5203 length:306 start_codon:yes stop_codon:yes gene_type:complete